MPVLKPRTRVVYFRVSEEEFEQFTRAREQEGARSLSDLFRSAMKKTMNGSFDGPPADAEDSVSGRLRTLDNLIGELSVRVEQLDRLLEKGISNGSHLDRRPQLLVNGKANAESA